MELRWRPRVEDLYEAVVFRDASVDLFAVVEVIGRALRGYPPSARLRGLAIPEIEVPTGQ